MEAAEIYTMMSANQRSVKLFSQSGKYIALDHRILTHNKQCPIPYPIHQFHHGGRCVRTLSSLRVGVSSCTRVHANTRALRTPSAPKHTPFLPLFLLLTFLSFLLLLFFYAGQPRDRQFTHPGPAKNKRPRSARSKVCFFSAPVGAVTAGRPSHKDM